MTQIKTKRLTRTIRDKLLKHCDAIKTLAKSMKSHEDAAAVLQNGVQTLLRGLDIQTRDYVYDRVETVLMAEEDAGECLINAQLLNAFDQLQYPLRVGIMTKKVADDFMKKVKMIDNEDKHLQYDIFRSVIMRLMMELPYKELEEMLIRTAPNLVQEKQRDETRHMYF